MKSTANSRRVLIESDILEYLVQHPDAQDTLEGIVQWWLLKIQIQYALTNVQSAVEALVSRGFLVAQPAQDGRTYYRADRSKEAEILTFLNEKSC